MAGHFDRREAQDRDARERDLFQKLPQHLARAMVAAPGLRDWLEAAPTDSVTDRDRLARLPVLRKSDLMERQAVSPPFGGFADLSAMRGRRIYLSPGPVWEPQGEGIDWAGAARALHAAGARSGSRIHNAFAYHMTPGAWIMDGGAAALGCTIFPAGTGNTEMQVEAAAALRTEFYCGTPDFLKAILDKALEMGRDLSSLSRGLVSGGALFPSLREEYGRRGVQVMQCYATAEFGVVAYETAGPDGAPLPGMILNEDLIMEIVRPGTGDPVPDGEVGEVVLTSFNAVYPLVRFGTGDLSRVLPEPSPCGRTNTRIAGWLGRADQRTKVKGMFVDPRQVAEIVARHPHVGRARLIVSRHEESDRMELVVEVPEGLDVAEEAIAASLREVTKLGGTVRRVSPGTLPNDGKVIADERDYRS